MRKLFKRKDRGSNDFWMSYTDLMSGFLIIFILIGIFAYHQLSQRTALLADQEAGGASLLDSLVNVNEHNHALIDSINNLRAMNDEAKDSLTQISKLFALYRDSVENRNIKNEIERYRPIFKKASDDNVSYRIDHERGSIILTHSNRNDNLFGTGESGFEWKEKGKNNKYVSKKSVLKDYIPKISKALVDTTMAIARENGSVELRIEGHTDPNWGDRIVRGSESSFVNNLDLSLRRAQTVYTCILSNVEGEDKKKFVMEHMICIGYSFSERLERDKRYPGSLANTSLDPDSRRIEFRILSKKH